jgi:preprotein translocase subunit SecA
MANLTYDDKIWVTSDRKLEGIYDDIILARSNGVNALVIAHFESTLSLVEAKLSDRSIDHYTFFPGDYTALCAKNSNAETVKVWLGLASYLQTPGSPTARRPEAERLYILFAEHHPMATKDQAVLESVTGLPCQSRIIFHTALTDALLLYFGGESLQGLLKRLGHDESTYLSHPMVTAAIRRAQEKISKQVHQEIVTRSAEEWFKYNLADRG